MKDRNTQMAGRNKALFIYFTVVQMFMSLLARETIKKGFLKYAKRSHL